MLICILLMMIMVIIIIIIITIYTFSLLLIGLKVVIDAVLYTQTAVSSNRIRGEVSVSGRRALGPVCVSVCPDSNFRMIRSLT